MATWNDFARSIGDYLGRVPGAVGDLVTETIPNTARNVWDYGTSGPRGLADVAAIGSGIFGLGRSLANVLGGDPVSGEIARYQRDIRRGPDIWGQYRPLNEVTRKALASQIYADFAGRGIFGAAADEAVRRQLALMENQNYERAANLAQSQWSTQLQGRREALNALQRQGEQRSFPWGLLTQYLQVRDKYPATWPGSQPKPQGVGSPGTMAGVPRNVQGHTPDYYYPGTMVGASRGVPIGATPAGPTSPVFAPGIPGMSHAPNTGPSYTLTHEVSPPGANLAPSVYGQDFMFRPYGNSYNLGDGNIQGPPLLMDWERERFNPPGL